MLKRIPGKYNFCKNGLFVGVQILMHCWKYVVLNGDSQKGVASLINVKWYTLRCTFAKSRMCAKIDMEPYINHVDSWGGREGFPNDHFIT